ncbi:methyltransferase domain-containing protein [Aliiglaciecola sp. 3_MG-2023]|uniref:methyltransferase domain-containing protein n=1 Tax=Aliiglaciecola sp. 3_MG-2023 TaxID=3062644 RepID=UPI0026E39084|nr:methyltransferase domain-containing protein [Aliiglaciecola sp. 3_MG-2023]MDO6694449.1 methyltransferase domain-containing protein [Aliiglaciecola sp. 3_MG-2023]
MNSLLAEKKRRIAYQFSQSAHRYDDIAQVQLDIGFDAIQLVTGNKSGRLLDIGCGTGRLTQRLADKFQGVTGVDLATGMIEQAKKCNPAKNTKGHIDFHVADAEALPFADKSFDNVFSCMALQWCTPIQTSLDEINRVLTDQGKGVLALLSAGSMVELHKTWAKVDAVPRVNQFLSHRELVSAAIKSGFSVEEHQKTYTTWHQTAIHLLNSIRHIGANVVPETGNHRRLSRQSLAEFARIYNQDFAINGQLPLSYEVSFLILSKNI